MWPVLGALALGGLGAALGWYLASDDINKVGDWRNGAARFVGMGGAIGLCVGWYATVRLTRGTSLARTGLMLGYKRIEPTSTGYREVATLTVEDLLARLRAVGYQPIAKACDELGTIRGPLDTTTPLAGSNVAITDPRVKGHIRVQLATPPRDNARALGLIETWSSKGDSATELALFALRALDGMLGDLTASYDDSGLSADPAKLFVVALPEKPQHRR